MNQESKAKNRRLIDLFLLPLAVALIAVFIQQWNTKTKTAEQQNTNPSIDNNSDSQTQDAPITIKTTLAGENSSKPSAPSPSTGSTKYINTISTVSENSKSEPKRDYSSYVNSSISNSDKTDISVIILDQKGNVASSISSSIAGIYGSAGNKSTTGLLRNSFIHHNEFSDLEEGNSSVITKLNLHNYTDYLAIGRLDFSIGQGQLVNGTLICSVSLSMNIINTLNKYIATSFTISKNGNGVTEAQAKESAIQNLLSNYYSHHATF